MVEGKSMFLRLKRILMTEADSGSGNGAVAQPSAETGNVPQAQGDAVTLGKSELDALIASAAAKAVADAKDSIFAEARRTFTGSKKDKPAAPADAAPPPQTVTDATSLRALDRALAKNGFAERLSESQYKRIEKLFVEESPADAGHWVKDYFDGFGVAPQPATQSQTATPAHRPVSEHPVSNRGAPPPAQVPLEETNILDMSQSDRDAYLKAKGPKAYVKKMQADLKGKTVTLR